MPSDTETCRSAILSEEDVYKRQHKQRHKDKPCARYKLFHNTAPLFSASFSLFRPVIHETRQISPNRISEIMEPLFQS